MLHTLETSDKTHYISENISNQGSKVFDEGIGDRSKGDRMGTKTFFNFSDESKDHWRNQNDNIEYSEFGDVVHEMQHQYDYDIGNMKDAEKKSSAKDPSEKRAVTTENIAREMENKEPRIKYGTVIIEYDAPDDRKERNNK